MSMPRSNLRLKIIRIGSLMVLLSLLALLSGCRSGGEPGWTFPHLPRPIASERVVITTAGQSPDGLIVAQLANSLRISYDYRKEINGDDLPGRFSSLIIVVGSSNKGMSFVNLSEAEELERVSSLVERAAAEQMPVILVHLGGDRRRGGFNEELIEAVSSHAHYLIVLKEGNRDLLFTAISQERGIPLTIVDSIDDVSTPLSSAYR